MHSLTNQLPVVASYFTHSFYTFYFLVGLEHFDQKTRFLYHTHFELKFDPTKTKPGIFRDFNSGLAGISGTELGFIPHCVNNKISLTPHLLEDPA